MSEQDGRSNPSAEEATEMAAFLETRAAFPDQAAIDRALLEALNLAPGERLLEAGCGSGLLCRQIAGRVAPDGHVTGIDTSVEMVIAPAKQDTWLAELRGRIAAGRFFASITYFIVLGRKG